MSKFFSERMKQGETNRRLAELEKNALKPKEKPKTPRAQQMLLLHHLGLLDVILNLKLSNIKTAKLLSILLNTDKVNIVKDLSVINSKKSKLKSSVNYAFLEKTFSEAGLEDHAKTADREYLRLKTEEEKK